MILYCLNVRLQRDKSMHCLKKQLKGKYADDNGMIYNFETSLIKQCFKIYWLYFLL